MQSEFLAENLQDYTAAFADDAAWQTANSELSAAYTPYNSQLATLFNGSHTLHLRTRDISVQIADFASQATFPWPRSFEVRIDVEMDVSVER